jgi:hypothetical protein
VDLAQIVSIDELQVIIVLLKLPHVQRVLKIPPPNAPFLSKLGGNSKSDFGVQVHGSLNNE